jgi:hypothetical protein
MNERGIGMNEMMEAVTAPIRTTATFPNSKTGAKRAKHIGKSGHRSVTVVVEYKTPEVWVLITTY